MAGTLICRGFPAVEYQEEMSDLIWSAETLWRLFETTGSVWAYLAYRQVAARPVVIARVSLN